MADPTPQQLAKALTLNERMGEFGFDPSLKRGTLLPFGTNQQGENEWAVPEIGYGMMKAFVLPGHVAQGGQWNENDVTDSALNIEGMGGFGSMGLGAKAVGGPGGKVLGMGVMNDPPPAFVLKADGVPGRAKELAELLQSQMPDAKVSISHNKSGVGESSYVTATYMPPHRKTGKYMTGEFRVSDHGVGPRRLGDYQDHINVGDPYDASKSINRMLESYARYKQETGTPHHLPTDTASRMARAREIYEQKIKEALESGDYEYVGLRTADAPIAEGDLSRVWNDGNPTADLLPGMSSTDARGGAAAMNQHLPSNPRPQHYYLGDYTAIVGADRASHGVDAGELVLEAPRVLFQRAHNALFDPAKADSADLLAMTGNPAMLAAGQNQDAGPPKMALELAKRLSDQEFYAKGGI